MTYNDVDNKNVTFYLRVKREIRKILMMKVMLL
jgi:hypothetical protein